MSILLITLLCLCFIVAPYYLTKLAQKSKLKNLLSDVVICFLVGIFLGNTQHWWLDKETQDGDLVMAKVCSALPVLLAIPMLLMVSDIRAFLRYAPKLILSFFFGVISVCIMVMLMAYWYQDLPNIAEAAGILTGVYIGGTPNMVAISYAIDAPESLFLILTATDVFSGGIYFLLLTSLAGPFLALLMPKFESKSTGEMEEELDLVDSVPFPPTLAENDFSFQPFIPLLQALGLAISCIVISAGVAKLVPNVKGDLNEMILISVLTTLSIALSFNNKIRNLAGVYNFAQYLLLIFAIAVGFMADFSKFVGEGGSYLIFNLLLVIGMVLLHFILAKLFRIDRDTYIITSVACIFGPPFIGPICSVLKNKELLSAGMALGVLGLIMGNYLGIFIFYLLQ